MKIRIHGLCLSLILLLLAPGKIFSHDFWLEAHPFYTQTGKSVDLSLHVGNEFVGDTMPNIASWYTDFSLYQSDNKKDVKGKLGRDPAGYFTPVESGTYVIGYQSTFSYTELDAKTFNKYLLEEGLNKAIEYRQQNHLQDNMGKENYIRHAKALVQAGDRFEVDNSNLKLGYELEIVPLQNPYKKNLGDSIVFQVLYKQIPIEDILLIAYSQTKPEQIQKHRTNRQGEAKIKLDKTGPWLIKAVKIFRVEEDKAEWQSHWASLTFSVRDTASQ